MTRNTDINNAKQIFNEIYSKMILPESMFASLEDELTKKKEESK